MLTSVYRGPSRAESEAEGIRRSFSPNVGGRAAAAGPAKHANFRGFGRPRVWPRPCLSTARRISSLEVERSHIDGACRTRGQRRSRAALRRRRAVVGVPVSEAHQAGERRGGQPSRRRRRQRPAAGRGGRCAAQSRQARGGGGEGQGGHEGPRHLGTWGAPKWPPIPPDVRRAPGNPWRASIFVVAAIFVVIRSAWSTTWSARLLPFAAGSTPRGASSSSPAPASRPTPAFLIFEGPRAWGRRTLRPRTCPRSITPSPIPSC